MGAYLLMQNVLQYHEEKIKTKSVVITLGREAI